MKSWKIARVAGIDVSVHWSFLLLLGWVAFSAFASGGAVNALFNLQLVIAVFGCVVLHELGHALAARQFGIATRGITLLPIGGVASLDRMPRRPLQELWIAVAGPLVNVLIAAALVLVIPLSQLTPLGLFVEDIDTDRAEREALILRAAGTSHSQGTSRTSSPGMTSPPAKSDTGFLSLYVC